MCYSLRHVQLFMIPWIVVLQYSLSMEFSRQNTGVGSHSFLWGLFLTQGSNSGLQHCRQILYHLSHHGNSHSGPEQL